MAMIPRCGTVCTAAGKAGSDLFKQRLRRLAKIIFAYSFLNLISFTKFCRATGPPSSTENKEYETILTAKSDTKTKTKTEINIIQNENQHPNISRLLEEKESEASRQTEFDVLLSGDLSCPCLMNIDTTYLDLSHLGSGINVTSYGIGCLRHDEERTICLNSDGSENIWCNREWCFVDPENCQLHHARSNIFPKNDNLIDECATGPYYSYAACHNVDRFTNNVRRMALEGQTYRVGMNHNSGGWAGSYSEDKKHYEGPISKWKGPTVEYVQEVAIRGNFNIQVTPPPDFLIERSKAFFKSSSKFDLCSFAVSLGYLDFCVSHYTVTDTRISATDFFVLDSIPLYLIMDQEDKSSWSRFVDQITLVFRPFDRSVWLLMIFFVFPTLGILFVFHEYGQPIYSRSEEIVTVDEQGQEEKSRRRIPLSRHIVRSCYSIVLSVLSESHGVAVTTFGGKVHLLALSFFYLIMVVAYTANLAAFFVIRSQSSVSSLTDAIREGYTFCGERKTTKNIREIFDIGDRFITDPISLGGDGLPGFDCTNCQARLRVFEMLNPELATKNDASGQYCHAAIARWEDLQALQKEGKHCSKRRVGMPLGYIDIGFPVFEGVSNELIAFFTEQKNAGLYQQKLRYEEDVISTTQCQNNDWDSNESESLSIEQLTGVWVVIFFLAIVALGITVMEKWKNREERKIRTTQKFDQWGLRVQKLDRTDKVGDDFDRRIHENLNNAAISLGIPKVSERLKRITFKPDKAYNKKVPGASKSFKNLPSPQREVSLTSIDQNSISDSAHENS
uniref:Ionotropic glutamate receptor C-terminal domain-containing protein n=1 Tax=Corethron hystrix TaxID=216773 RepID=A0A7S1BB65_9STRA|mmetsp:Transcript_2002/g.4042  ORF Transcript_2002/g.4042 Transcript_2002/m.4042 type:complete len:788 (+) Transcript_2002:141-2504(+)